MFNKSGKILDHYLSRYLDGELSPHELEYVESILDQREDLKQKVEEQKKISQQLEKTLGDPKTMENIKSRFNSFLSALPHRPLKKENLRVWRAFTGWPYKNRIATQLTFLFLCIFLYVAMYVDPQLQLTGPKVSSADKESLDSGGSMELWYKEQMGKTGGTERQYSMPALETEAFQSLGYTASSQNRYSDYQNLFDSDGDGVQDQLTAGTFGSGMGMAASGGNSRGISKGVDVAENRKVIRSGRMAMEVKSVSAALDALKQTTDEFGGLTAQLSITAHEAKPSAELTVWIPSKDLERALNEFGTIGKVLNLQLQAQDITEEYFDMETRIRNLKKQEERLLSLYDREVKKLDEILKVEVELNRVRTEIERLEGKQRLWVRQVQMASIHISIIQKQEEIPIAVSEPDDIFSPLRRALKNIHSVFFYSCSMIATGVSWLIATVVFILPWLLVAFIAWMVFRMSKKHKKPVE